MPLDLVPAAAAIAAPAPASAAAAPDLRLFFLLVAGVIVLPGMDMAYVAGSALVGGLRAGAAAVAGIVTGGLVHVAVAMAGLATLLSVWPAAFDAVLVAGSAYMAWVGWQIGRAAGGEAARIEGGEGADAGRPVTPAPHRRLRVYRRAVLTCLSNPKAYAFSLAVFPAFVHAAGRPAAVQGLLLASIVAATQATVYGGVALAAARTGRVARAGARTRRTLSRAVAMLLMGGAVATVALGWRPAHAQGLPSTPPSVPVPVAGAAGTDAPRPDPAHDFDFLMGRWQVENRKRLHVLAHDDRWETFAATSEAWPLPGGVGDTDCFRAPGWRQGYVGVTLRVYSPVTRTWALYWVGRNGGGLDPRTGALLAPVVGAFQGDTGVFEGDDTWEGRPIRVRYTWRRLGPDHAGWEQAFSADGGRTWETNWTMRFTRLGPAAPGA